MIEKNIEINGVKIFTRIAGEGDPFLILHGWGASTDSWVEIQERLSKNFQVILLDFPGFGKSDFPPEAWGVQNYCEFVLDFTEKMGLEKFNLLGHSFGGRVCIKLAAQFPEKIKKLILVDSAGIEFEKRISIRLRTRLASFMGIFKAVPGFKIGRKFFYKFIMRNTDYFEAMGIMKEVFKKVIAEDLTSWLGKISVPTLIVWGKKDKLTPIKNGYLMKKKIKNSEIKVFDTGHSPHLLEPELLTKEILDFLK